MTPIVAATEPVAAQLGERVAELTVPVRLVRLKPDGAPRDDPARADVLCAAGLNTQSLRRSLQAIPGVRWVHVFSAGVDRVLVPEIVDRGIALTRTRGVHDRTVSEFAMALILLAAKRLPQFLEAQARRDWLDLQPAQLAGSTLVIVGYGEIGRALARRARPFDMRVVGVRRRHPENDDRLADEVVGVERLHHVLASADYVVLVAPATHETRHLIGRDALGALPDHAYLINVGRGSVLDEEALVQALDEGQLAGALLDTPSVEPLPSDHPLWTHPKVVVTPHAAGIRPSNPGALRLDQFIENLQRYSRGEPLLNQVDTRLGY